MNYRIKYEVTLLSGIIPDKEIIVKNKDNELYAKVSLEDYLKRKYGDSFIRLVITDCVEDNPAFDIFNKIFSGRW